MPAEHRRRISRAKRYADRWDAELEDAVSVALADGVAPAAVARILGITRQSMRDRMLRRGA